MILDAQLLLSDAQAFTATGLSTNVLDLGSDTPTRDIGVGEPLSLLITVDTAADATTGDETYTFELLQSAAANMGSPTVLSSMTIARALLLTGAMYSMPLSPGLITQRYLSARLTLGGTTPSITVTIALLPTNFIQRNQLYRDAIVIS